jgi:hypothetical protein
MATWGWKETWVNESRTRGIYVANDMVPLTLGVGCHVAPSFIGLKLWWSPWDSNPGPPHMENALAKST